MRVSKEYKKLGFDQLLTFVIILRDMMTADEQFKEFEDNIAVLRAKITELEAAMAVSTEGGKIATKVKNEKKEAVINATDTLAEDVDKLADGDEKIIWAAGFNTTKTHSKITSIATPKILQVGSGEESGSVKLKFSTVTGRVNYAILIKEAGRDEPVLRFSSKMNRTLHNFEPGQQLTIQAMALGRNDLSSEWSEPVNFWVN